MFNLFRKAPAHPFRASLYANPDFYCFKTISGIDIGVVDPRVEPILLEPNATNAQLARALFKSLLASRAPKHRRDPDLYNYRNAETAYKKWRGEMMAKFGYKTQKKMFEDMRSLSFEYNRYAFTLSVERLVQEKPQSWTASKRYPKTVLDSKLDPEHLGEEIRRLSQY